VEQGPPPQHGLSTGSAATRLHRGALGSALGSDITEFACEDGTMFLAAIRDLHDHSIAGLYMGERQTTDLGVAALVLALGRRTRAMSPCITPIAGRNSRGSGSPTGSIGWKLAGAGSVGDATTMRR
jgi:hypothetical protein